MIPEYPPTDTSSQGEFDLWLRLRDDIDTRGWIVLHSLDIAKHNRKVAGELDFVVIIPGLGVLCLEIKACHRLHRDDAGWYYGNDRVPDARGPFKQASQGMFSLRDYLKEHCPDLNHLVFWTAVVFPYVIFNEPSIEWHSWQVIDAQAYRSRPISQLLVNVISMARNHLENTPDAKWFHPQSHAPYPEQCNELAEVLRPRFEFFEHPSARRNRMTSELKFFTDEQLDALATMELNPRVFFQGAAGTGKTLLAIEAARRSVAAGRRVLLLCFNRLLGEWLQRETSSVGPALTTKTIHQYFRDVSGLAPPQNADFSFWQIALPEKALDVLLEDDSFQRYDELILDEAQDVLLPQYLDILDMSLTGGLAAGRWRMFGDSENQLIYTDIRAGGGITAVDFCELRGGHAVPYSLRINCRNTPRIASWAEVLGRMKPGYARVRRPDDQVEPKLIFYGSQDEQIQLLVQQLEELYLEGYQGRDIVVLSTRAPDRAIATRVIAAPWKERLHPFDFGTGGYVHYSSIHAFKGLEASAIVVTDVDAYDERSMALIFVATTRALNRLTLLVDKQASRQISAWILGETA